MVHTYLVPKGLCLAHIDGDWDNSVDGVDPMRVAQQNAHRDMRSDLTGTRNITTYTINSFGTERLERTP